MIHRVVALAAAFLLVTASARADDGADARANAAKQRGDDALVSGRASDALAAYEEAYAAKPDPALVFNIGRARMAIGDNPGALEWLERFAAEAPADLRAKVPGLDKLLREVRAKVSTLVVSSNVEGATVSVGGRTIGKTPLKPIPMNAGIATLVIEKEGFYAYKHDVTLPGAGVAAIDARLESKETSGVLVVTSALVGARVALDGKPEGTVPSELVVSVGQHEVTLSHEGYRPAQASVVVSPGQTKTLAIDQLESEAPITKKWWFWTGVGVVVAGAAITVVALTTEKDAGSGSFPPGRISAGLHF